MRIWNRFVFLSTLISLLSVVLVHPVVAASSFNTIESEVIGGGAYTVYLVFPDDDVGSAKPTGVLPASVSDWTALGFLYGACTNLQNIVTDTDSSVVNTDTGEPVVDHQVIVVFGGPIINSLTYYYESSSVSPVFWVGDGSVHRLIRTSDGVDLKNKTYSEVSYGSTDVFVVETFNDAKGNSVYMLYGFGWKGTLAAGLYFKDVILPSIQGDPGQYSNSYHIFEWVDGNGNKFVETQEINEI